MDAVKAVEEGLMITGYEFHREQNVVEVEEAGSHPGTVIRV